MKNGIVRSPLFYVGDKFRLIKEIRQYFPQQINQFIEPFVGGGSVMMNVDANNYLLNDIDNYVISIHKMLCSFVGNKESLFERMFEIIENYGLSLSFRNNTIPKDLKEVFPKTYFAKYNKEAYNKLKADFNSGEKDDMIKLYVLLIYGFNRMLRFNSRGEFNIPVGNVDFNKNTKQALDDYLNVLSGREVEWFNSDFRTFLSNVNFQNKDLIYLDPPYLITFSEYNKYWNENVECEMLALLDELNERGIHFAISNVTHYKGRINEYFLQWSKKYAAYPIKSNYISFNDNSIKQFREVLVVNY